ncbi:MAG: carbohydrate ABC transporter permease, partial [Ilumatobacter sp.]
GNSMSTSTAALEAAGQQAKKVRKSPMFQGRDRVVFTLMVAVPTTIHVLFVWIPTIASLLFSFTNYNGIRFSEMEVVGFRNYWEIFTVFEKDFFQAVLNNFLLLIFLFVGPTIFGMGLAYLLDKNIRGSRIYQSMFYTPVVLSLAVVGFMWQSVIYSTENGLATELFGGGEAVDWIGNQSFLFSFEVRGGEYGLSKNFLAILVAIAWRHTGYIMVLYLAGLKSVDNSLREAASLDGANEWQAFRRVIFPTLKPINVVIAVITVIEALRAYDIIAVLNEPRKTEVLSILTTNNLLGEGGGNVGRGSAYAAILFILCLGFVIWYVTNHYKGSQEGAES